MLDISKVFHILKYNELFAKLLKCEFWFKSLAFLSHIVSDDGIRVDSQKIEALQSCP